MTETDPVHAAYVRYYRGMVGQMYALTGDLAEAEDVVQEAFVRAVARRNRFDEAAEPRAWLLVVALNIARTRYRRRWTLDVLIRGGRLRPPTATPGPGVDRLALVAALRSLPLATREVVVLHHVADLPVAEIAALLGLPEGTVKARLSRGRAALARRLAPDTTDRQELPHV